MDVLPVIMKVEERLWHHSLVRRVAAYGRRPLPLPSPPNAPAGPGPVSDQPGILPPPWDTPRGVWTEPAASPSRDAAMSPLSRCHAQRGLAAAGRHPRPARPAGVAPPACPLDESLPDVPRRCHGGLVARLPDPPAGHRRRVLARLRAADLVSSGACWCANGSASSGSRGTWTIWIECEYRGCVTS